MYTHIPDGNKSLWCHCPTLNQIPSSLDFINMLPLPPKHKILKKIQLSDIFLGFVHFTWHAQVGSISNGTLSPAALIKTTDCVGCPNFLTLHTRWNFSKILGIYLMYPSESLCKGEAKVKTWLGKPLCIIFWLTSWICLASDLLRGATLRYLVWKTKQVSYLHNNHPSLSCFAQHDEDFFSVYQLDVWFSWHALPCFGSQLSSGFLLSVKVLLPLALYLKQQAGVTTSLT